MELSRRERGGFCLLAAFVCLVAAVVLPDRIGLVGVPFGVVFAAAGVLRLAGLVD